MKEAETLPREPWSHSPLGAPGWGQWRPAEGWMLACC